MGAVLIALGIGLFQIFSATASIEEDYLQALLDATPIHPTFAASKEPNPILPSGHILKNYFHRDFGLIKPFEGCTINATNLKTGDNGNITTPNYPKNYTSELDCYWFVESEPGTIIEATFFDFVTQTSHSPLFFSYFDYVSISRDGSFSTVDNMAGNLNDRTPMTIESISNRLGIRFKSSKSINYRGFKIQYIVKPENLTDFIEPSPFDGFCGTSYLLEPEYDPKYKSLAYKPDRIIGNNTSPPHAFPWMVALLMNNGGFCGGSIIDDQHIITAAHCTDGATSVIVVLGGHNLRASREEEPDRRVVRVTQENIFQHPDYDRYTVSHDITILRLTEKMNFTDKMLPICLPNRYRLSKTYISELVQVAGWGKTADNAGISSMLQNTTVNITTNNYCNSVFFRIDPQEGWSGNQMCTETTPTNSPCNGDSGGPLFIRQTSPTGDYYMILGLVSFGAHTCEESFPIGYTRVMAFLDYIELITGKKIV